MANGKGNRGGGGDNRTLKLTCRKKWEIIKGAHQLTLDFTFSKQVNGQLTGSIFGQPIQCDIVNGRGKTVVENVNPGDIKSQLEVACDTDSDGVVTLSEEVIISQPVNGYKVSIAMIEEYEVPCPDQPNELRILLTMIVRRTSGAPYANLIGLRVTCAGESKEVTVNTLGIGKADFGPATYGKEYEVFFNTPEYGEQKEVIVLSTPPLKFTAMHKLHAPENDGVPKSFEVTVSTFDAEKHANPVIWVTVQIGTTCHRALTQPDGRVTFSNLPLEVGKNETHYTVWVPGDVHEDYTIVHSDAAPATPRKKDKSFLHILKEVWKK